MPKLETIDESEALIRWLDSKIIRLEVSPDFRHCAAAACFSITAEYHKAILLLIAKELNGPAFASVRLMFESYVRGIWIHQCADEADIEKARKDNMPKFYKLVEDVEKLEPYEGGTLSRLKKNSWAAMNSFTHTGMQQITRYNTEEHIEPNYDEDEISEVIGLANVFGYLAAIAISDLANDVELANEILEKMKNEQTIM